MDSAGSVARGGAGDDDLGADLNSWKLNRQDAKDAKECAKAIHLD